MIAALVHRYRHGAWIYATANKERKSEIMGKYIGKRLLSLIPVIFIVTFIVFVIMHITPGGPAAAILGLEASPEEVARLNAELGLEDPFWVQYWNWLSGVLTGDLGHSYYMNRSVNSAIAANYGPTVALALFATFLSVIFGVGFGLLAVYYRKSWVDRLVVGSTLVGQATPSFVLSILLLILFAVVYRIFPVSGYRPLSSGIGQHLRYLFLPSVAIAIGQTALIARITRSSLLEIVDANYILTGRMKGLSERSLLLKHSLKNALLPILTVIGQGLGGLLSGTIVVETIFGIPGLGQLLVNGISRRDYAVIQGVILMIAVSYILVNLAVDVLYSVIDPRIALEAKKD